MDKEIIIYSGDEHRAKMEKQFSRKDIFADVYGRAYRLLREIENEMAAYRDEIEKNKNRLSRYQGLGNNMIIFCGGRGQGKTSVMQSFAKCLDGTYKEDQTIDRAERLEFTSEVSKGKLYEVVDSIDPSAMESDESILKVLISRLFFRLEEYIKSDACPAKDDKDFLQNKKDIVKLFEKCYANIACIKSGKGIDCEQDDLQTLSQMGSSARLKENLHDLIDKYLVMMAGGKRCEGHQCRYLVIPIDDADLATKKLFRFCEDIRNYLSIPNVIILMAVDYEQLVHAIYQRYLKQYKVMREVDAASEHRLYVEAECHRMAAKYLEKVFPTIHRIDLPQIDNILIEGYENIKFRYMLMVKPGEYVSAFDEKELDKCKNVQEQLLRILYRRTGIIFSNQKMHPFMPHTLRELTHWVKMLCDMHGIDCDTDVYQKSADKIEDGISQLRENILTIKQYFMSYWCEKYLEASQVRVLREIDSATKQHRMAEVANILSEYIDETTAEGMGTYREVMHDIVESRFEGKGSLQEAIYIYYTIFLNEWFAVALKDNMQFKEIVRFVERTADLSKYHNYKYKGIYNIMQFQLNANVLRHILGSPIEPSVEACIKNFCVVVQNGRIREDISTTYVVDRQVQWNPAVETLAFDILRPVIVQLKENKSISDAKDVTDNSVEDDKKEQKSEYDKMPYLITVRNVLANYDVQIQMRDIVDSWYETVNVERNIVSPGELIPQLYKEVQNGMSTYQYESDHGIAGICEQINGLDKEFVNTLFLCNQDNLYNHIIRINDCLRECYTSVEKTAGSVKKEGLGDTPDKLVGIKEQVGHVLEPIETGLSEVWIKWDKFTGICSRFDLSSIELRSVTSIYTKITETQKELTTMLEKIQKQIDPIEKSETEAPELEQESSTDNTLTE